MVIVQVIVKEILYMLKVRKFMRTTSIEEEAIAIKNVIYHCVSIRLNKMIFKIDSLGIIRVLS